MTIRTKTKVSVCGISIEREFEWDALSSLLRLPFALLARAGEADRVDQENGRQYDSVRPT